MKTSTSNLHRKQQHIESEERPLVLEVNNLCKSFGDNHVLVDFNMKLYEGENMVILGRSGSGKTVFIKCLVGLMGIDSGMVNILGRNVHELDQKERDNLRTDIGFLFQGSALYDSMTVRENLEFPLRRHPEKIGDLKDTRPLVLETLENVGLAHAIDLMPSELSGGMKKRVALARTLMLKPRIILYDEPTTGLDPITGKEIAHLILDIQQRYNTSSITITHDMVCTRIIANRIITLVEGRNFAEGTYEELKNHQDPRVGGFFL